MTNTVLYQNPNSVLFEENSAPEDVSRMLVVTGTSTRVAHPEDATYNSVVFDGSNFVITNGRLSAGTVTTITAYKDLLPHSTDFITTGLSMPVSVLLGFASSNDGLGLMKYIYGGDDVISNSGNNCPSIMAGYGGNDTLIGGLLTDTAVYVGKRAEYVVKVNSDGSVSVADTISGRDGTDTLTSIERLQLSDKSIALDTSGGAGQAYRLYQAALNRTPDAGGLGYQMKTLDDGWPLATVAQNFINSPEFSATYGSLNNTDFVQRMYQNVLHRTGVQSELDYYVPKIDAGTMSRAAVLVGFSESPENQAAVIDVIQNGMTYTV